MRNVEPRLRARLAALAQTCREPWARVCVVVVAVLCAAALAGLRVNVSRSYPIGLYHVVGGAASMQRGSVVVVCLPVEWARFARQRGILGPGHCEGGTYGLGKMVLAMEGDVVELRPEGITVNGSAVARSRTLDRDSRGRPLPQYPPGRYVLRQGEVWLFSGYAVGAFDSRYFGPVFVSRVRAVIRPLWTE
ncbi:MAG TPA: conjugative transfer signal peptidase TraF [Longimicrobiaceae bacterium]|nr:conjugative transfer signal peptidase TraF [Longimicrobiaceae bacterium]